MATTKQILDQLNGYQGEDVWGDVILRLEEYDEKATEALGAANDQLALVDGTVLAYSAGSFGGSAHSPHAAGWYEV